MESAMTAPRDPKKPYTNPAELGGSEPALPELSDEGWDFDGAALDAALSQAPASGDGRPKASRSTQPLSFDRSLDEDDARPGPPPAFLPIQTSKFVRHDDEDPQPSPHSARPTEEPPGAAELMSCSTRHLTPQGLLWRAWRFLGLQKGLLWRAWRFLGLQKGLLWRAWRFLGLQQGLL
jgi:hypothetical protein